MTVLTTHATELRIALCVGGRMVGGSGVRSVVAAPGAEIRVLELARALGFAAIDYLTRRLAGERPQAPMLVVDLHRVPYVTEAGRKLI